MNGLLCSARSLCWTIILTASHATPAVNGMESAAEAAESGNPRPELRVTVDPDVLQSDEHAEWIRARGNAALTERPLPPGLGITVNLRGNPYDYQVTITMTRDGEPLDIQPEPFSVEGPSTELLARVERAIDEAADLLMTTEREDSTTNGPAPPTTPPPPVRRPPLQTKPRLARLVQEAATNPQAAPEPDRTVGKYRVLRATGTILTAIGSMSLFTGITLAGVGETPYANDDRLRRNWRPPAYVVIGTSIPVMAAGIVLLVRDAVACHRGTIPCSSRRAAPVTSASRRRKSPWASGAPPRAASSQ